ncbi:DUF3800 domain-containing protein [Thiohalophilus sp.]|uniref:DUF3800 domain-containing protein n=1 Tax=Thiohalophilus sp. TaxID=3028392 RepID=UPI002ACE3AD7|nr:DUF3800 domain-containing protein [Thiohalophilus sp.]MDZ7660905.1 DUF3800 domain-containing protein [Thiohalophilus sp.]
MGIFFSFSDENGAYEWWRSSKFLRAHPWYVRSTVFFKALEWKPLETSFNNLKSQYDLPANNEIKWSFAWSLKSHRKTGKPITEKDKYYFLKNYDPDKLERFLVEAVALLTNISYCKVIFTVTDNKICPRIQESRLLRMHLQESMQRLEMDMEQDEENLCVPFIDPVSRQKDKTLREAYSELYRNGDLYKRYSHIKDSLNIEYSHHSVGIQVADFLAGAFGSLLNERDLGREVYRRTIHEIIRKKADGQVSGYGVREVPGNKRVRAAIVELMQGAYT